MAAIHAKMSISLIKLHWVSQYSLPSENKKHRRNPIALGPAQAGKEKQDPQPLTSSSLAATQVPQAKNLPNQPSNVALYAPTQTKIAKIRR